jgi:hypothetical protein
VSELASRIDMPVDYSESKPATIRFPVRRS